MAGGVYTNRFLGSGCLGAGFWALAFEFRVRGSKGFDSRVVRFRFWAAGLRVSGFRV